jgi:glycosyltransferase involved in cell wall biosynthesis
MTPRQQLSVVILAKNEEARIGRCLASAAWADELIVVDGLSTDRTAEICRGFGARVISRPFSGSFAEERNAGLEAALGDWVLQIDADDVLTPAFRAAVERLLGEPQPYAAFKFRRKSILMGRFMRYGGWHHYLPNLVRRGRARYVGRVHERPELDGPLGVLDADIEHHPCESLAAFVSRHNRYTSLQAQELLETEGSRPARRIAALMVRKPWKTFWKTYVKKQGFREGTAGFLFSALYAWIEFVKWAKYWELSTQPAAGGPSGSTAGMARVARQPASRTSWRRAATVSPSDLHRDERGAKSSEGEPRWGSPSDPASGCHARPRATDGR